VNESRTATSDEPANVGGGMRSSAPKAMVTINMTTGRIKILWDIISSGCLQPGGLVLLRTI
jgi:hypothetical protein